MSHIVADAYTIYHRKGEFRFVFTFYSPDGRTRKDMIVVIEPAGAKSLHKDLGARLQEYERQHGKIEPWPKPKREGLVYIT